MLVNRENIVQFIPQRPPVVMIHELIEAEETFAVTSTTVESMNIFFEEGHLAESGMVENIAQTAAAHAGYQCSLHNLPPPLGYIAAIKNLKIVSMPALHDVIRTTIRVTNQVFNVTIVNAEMRNRDEVICSCEMRVFIQDLPVKPTGE